MQQGDIYLVNLDPAVGSEIKKSRPCVIINNDAIGILPLKIIAPITDFKEKFRQVPWMIEIHPDGQNNLDKPSVIDVFQVRSVSEERFIKKIGAVSNTVRNSLKEALKTVFGIG